MLFILNDKIASDFKFYNYCNTTNSDFNNDLLILIYEESTQHYYQIIYNDSINFNINLNSKIKFQLLKTTTI